MRFSLIVLVWFVAARLGRADVPAELAAALQQFRSDVPRGWSFTQTTSAEGKSTVERSDATRPEFERWTLLQKDGRPPTPDETRAYAVGRSRRSRGGTAPKLAEQLDLSEIERVADDNQRAMFRCRLKPAENGDQTATYLRAIVVVHKPTHTIESIELRSTGPFSPTFGVKITELSTLMTYSLPSAEIPSLPQKVATSVRGTAFWFKSLDAGLLVVFSDYASDVKKNRPAGK